MRKLIYILIIGVFIACSKEDSLTPSEVKNWYVITPTENMDEVDDMIYQLYEKYDIAVFYKDTIGSEDRGWKDENGNPKLYYEVLRLDYDMTEEVSITNKITFNKVNVSDPESKATMLPLLDLMNEKLLAWIDGVDVFVPAILIVQDMVRGATPMYVYRGFGVLGFAMNGYEQSNPDSLFQREFLHEICYGALQESLSSFQTIVTGALENTEASPSIAQDCWGLNYNMFVSSYTDNLNKLNSMQSAMDTKLLYEEKKKEALEQLERDDLTEEERIKWENQVTLADNMIAAMDNLLANYDEYKTFVEQNGPENFGLLALNKVLSNGTVNYYVPTEKEDFAAYLDAVLDYEKEEFIAKYEAYPYVQARYALMENLLQSVGFDIVKIRVDLNNN